MKVRVIRPNYVKQLPEQLEDGILYISEDFNLTAHKCCCGCGEDVYNKLSPVRWRLTKSSEGSVSLDPSVGNWKYPCHSHYWIRNNRVIDAGQMSSRAIEAVKRRDRQDRDRHIAQVNVQFDNKRSMNFWSFARSIGERILHRIKTLWRW